MDFAKQTALITGASAGIGAVFARELARRGADVVLVARRADRLADLAARLTAEHAITATAITADLAKPGAARALAGDLAARGITVDVLVNNAGFGTHGSFTGQDPERLTDQITVNVTALVELTSYLLPGLVERDRGAVINVASTAGFQPLPYFAVYGATKAFVLSFTEALWGELSGTGVHAIALCPGATDTEFFDVAGEAARAGRPQTPEQVVAVALRALGRSSPPPSVISGLVNSIGARSQRLAPRRLVIRAAGRIMAPPRPGAAKQ